MLKCPQRGGQRKCGISTLFLNPSLNGLWTQYKNILKPERILRYIDKDCDEEECDRNPEEPWMGTLLEILTPIIILVCFNAFLRSFIAAHVCQLRGTVCEILERALLSEIINQAS